MCDALAKDLGIYILAPGCVTSWWTLGMPGGWRIPVFLAWVWWYAGASATNPKFLAHVEPHLQSLDIKSYSIMGFCLVRFDSLLF